jgi:hypothetical protein
MKTMSQWTFAALLALSASAVQAQAVGNSCQKFVDGPVQGVHVPTADVSGTPVDGSVWPPNHNFRTVKISAENQSDPPKECDVTITDVRQDEAVTGFGSGNFAPDSQKCSNVGNTSQVDLRGERAGTGTGRFYTVSFKMHDPDFPFQDKMGTATLIVPHDQGVAHLDTYVNEGPTYASYATSNTDATTMLNCPQ